MVGKGVNKEVEKMNKRRAKESGKKGLERMEEKRIRGKERRDEEQGKDVEETGQVGKVDHRHKRVEKGDVGKRGSFVQINKDAPCLKAHQVTVKKPAPLWSDGNGGSWSDRSSCVQGDEGNLRDTFLSDALKMSY
ncbi:hypothetical protein KUCAC02_018513 [Chaenocephalus aceratus]|uniref:Uncharacterized protein n=1 Tax=Chaenocephalus aceratus TaxID=36190 RepID=A0ACB9WA44_CHAAC|nr:hypothetical protein KUCAC02_018513 [Chaenocephalus aceratus]